MKRVVFVAFVILIALYAGIAHALIWDVTNDYSSLINPNAPWSYGYESVVQGVAFTAYNISQQVQGYQSYQWYSSGAHASDYCPTIWKNVDTTTLATIKPGEVSIHPGTGGYPDYDTYLSVVRWTAPDAMTVSVSGSFGAGDSGPMSYYIFLNNNPLLTDISDPNAKIFSFTRTVAKGDTLDFAVGDDLVYGIGGGWGNTPLSLTISTVPIPGALFLFAPALAGLVGLKRRFGGNRDNR
jgi:hypothetical protein